MPAWLQGKLIEKKQWSAGLISLKFSTNRPFKFTAGQFVNVGLDTNETTVSRPYSLINTPHDPLLEIHFNVVEEGQLSPQLANLAIGDNVKISERANGLLTLDEVPNVPNLWLLATGTGIGPFISILKSPEPWQRFDKIILAYSVKTRDKQAYYTEFEDLQSRYPDQFCFVSFITREKVEQSIHSRITASLENSALEDLAGVKLLPDSSHVMLCGNSKMITDVTALLEHRGMRRHTRREPGQITIEKYY